MDRQRRYRRLFARQRPGWKDCLDRYREAVDPLVRPGTRVLDVGCGHGEVLRHIYARTKETYGIEPDAEALARNQVLRHKAVGLIERIPAPDGFFDVIVSDFVMEHIDDPKAAAEELARVLRPGGSLVFLTPNRRSPVVWIIRAIPNALHDWLVRRLYGREEGDTYPVRYRLNDPRTIRRILGDAGFKEVQLMHNPDPTYTSFGPVSFWSSSLFERIIDRFPSHRVHLIAHFKKTA